MLIIPRTPTPPPLEDRDVTTLDQHELRELQKQLKALKVGQYDACARRKAQTC